MAHNNRKRRDASDISNRRLPLLNNYVPYNPLPSTFLTEIEDRRQWHPLGVNRPARSFNRAQHTLQVPKYPKRQGRAFRPYKWPTAQIGFTQPDQVLVCVRRKQRREVLHALKKAGRGGQRRPRYNLYSKITCRR